MVCYNYNYRLSTKKLKLKLMEVSAQSNNFRTLRLLLCGLLMRQKHAIFSDIITIAFDPLPPQAFKVTC